MRIITYIFKIIVRLTFISFPKIAHLISAFNPNVVSESMCFCGHRYKILPIALTALHFTLSLSFAALTLT